MIRTACTVYCQIQSRSQLHFVDLSSGASGLEAFSRYPTHDSFSALPGRATEFTSHANQQVGGQAVLGRQLQTATPWLTERLGYYPTSPLPVITMVGHDPTIELIGQKFEWRVALAKESDQL